MLFSLSIKCEISYQLALIRFNLSLRKIVTYSRSISPVLANSLNTRCKHVSDKADAIHGKRFPYNNRALFIDKIQKY